jgi:hypothetical protein
MRRVVICLASLLSCAVSPLAGSKESWPSSLKPLPDWAWTQIAADLAPFADGIERSQLDVYCREENGQTVIDHPTFKDHREGVMRIQIRNNQIHLINPERLSYRSEWFVEALKWLAQRAKLPDTEFIHILEDGINPAAQGPVFGNAKQMGTRGLLHPDFEMLTAYRSWGDFDQHFEEEPRWKEKIKQLIWRGSTTGGIYTLDNWWTKPRSKLVLYSLDHPSIVDARFVAIVQSEPGVAELLTERGMLAQHMGISEQLRYRYQIDVDGNSCTYSHLYWILRANSTALKVDSDNIQWYYQGLEPWVHYVPVSDDYSDLAELITWLNVDDEAARAIAKNGTRFAEQYLNSKMARSYLYALIVEYTKLLQ